MSNNKCRTCKYFQENNEINKDNKGIINHYCKKCEKNIVEYKSNMFLLNGLFKIPDECGPTLKLFENK